MAFYVAGWEGSSASPDAAVYAAVRFIRSLCFVFADVIDTLYAVKKKKKEDDS